MRSPNQKIIFTAFRFVLCGMLCLSCSQDYNPFTDPINTRVLITARSFEHGDTISLFSTETLTVMIPVPALARSLTVVAPANRLFRDGIRRYSASDQPLTSGPYRFGFSMYDTGMQTIEILLERENGVTIKQEMQCFVRSPLDPRPVSGSYGGRLFLATAKVNDRDVIYE